MLADIITIGDELLIGQVVDTNSAYIASRFNDIGVKVNKIISVSDTEQAILETLESSIKVTDIVIITGGLGPTNDDITKNTLAKYFNSKLTRNKEVEEDLEIFFANRGKNLIEINRSQADIPDNCQIIRNINGTAPGMLFKMAENKIVISLPGVPFEMTEMIENYIVPFLRSNYTLPVRHVKTFLTTGVAESLLAQRLTEFEKTLPKHFSFAYLPSPGIVKLRISCEEINSISIRDEFDHNCKQLELLLGDDLFGFNSENLELVVGNLLVTNGFSLSTAESCTGGNIAHLLTTIPGSSAYFLGGVVAYSNQVKENILNVSAENLNNFGAVSEQVIKQMAKGARKIFNSDFSIATSGIAGPTGGSAEKPVGTVWIAVATQEQIFTQKFNFGNDRKRTITRSSLAALNMLRLQILKIVEKTDKKV